MNIKTKELWVWLEVVKPVCYKWPKKVLYNVTYNKIMEQQAKVKTSEEHNYITDQDLKTHTILLVYQNWPLVAYWLDSIWYVLSNHI